MKNHEINQFKTAKIKMLQRKQELERQLQEITAALAMDNTVAPARPRLKPGVNSRNYGDLTEAVKAALLKGPQTKREILAQLRAQKFAFGGPPLKVLDSVIYTPHFTRSGKLFSLTKLGA